LQGATVFESVGKFERELILGLDNLPSGVYILQVKADSNHQHIKLIKR
jgi:hypothetical protein